MRCLIILGLVANFLLASGVTAARLGAQQPLHLPGSKNGDAAAPPPLESHNAGGVTAPGAAEGFEDQQVWRLGLGQLSDLERKSVRDVVALMDLDIWRQSHTEMDIRIPSFLLPRVRNLLPTQTAFTLFIPDVQALVIDNASQSDTVPAVRTEWDVSNLDTPFHSAYHPIEDMYDFGAALVAAFGGKRIDDGRLHLESLVIGKTYEEREIRGYRVRWVKDPEQPAPTEAARRGKGRKVLEEDELEADDMQSEHADENDAGERLGSGWRFGKRGGKGKKGHKGHKGKKDKGKKGKHGKGKGKGKKKKNIEREFVVQSGSHAREWVGPSSAIYFLHSLLLTGVNDPMSEEATLLKSFTFTVVPNINPDGYEYSRQHRMWRKNRQEIGSRSCQGIDLNSNWGYKWRKPQTSSPCSDSFAGSEAFEAYETKAMAKYLDDGIPWSNTTAFGKGDSREDEAERKVRAFLDLHSYGQLFMFPFAHSCDDFPPDAEMLMEAGLGVAKAMRVEHGETYQTGQACELTYRAPGDAIDYAYGTSDIRWSFSAELRDTGTYGFMLPPSLIRAAAGEITTGLVHLAKFIYNVEIVN